MGRPRRSSVSTPVKDSGPVRKRGRPESAASGDLEEHEPSKKRGRREEGETDQSLHTHKLLKLGDKHKTRGSGRVLTVGQGDTGQLGLGEDVMEKTRPALVDGIHAAVEVAAGGMHTAVLDTDGAVWTFGCNDEGSLGRKVEEEEDCFSPGKVELPDRVVMVSCGDSHTAALTTGGQVWAWGTFRDSSGPIGLVKEGVLQTTPILVLPGASVVKISSGSDHLVMLTQEGELYSMGNAEQGQLGRVNEKFAHRGGRRGLETFLKPERIHVKGRFGNFVEVWAGSYNTVAVTHSGHVVVCGLNNYNQMGIVEGLTFYMPVVSDNLSARKWDNIAIGQHHTVGQDVDGSVLALGRCEYGRLGLGEEGAVDAKVATHVEGVKECVEVACGTAVSYAVTKEGQLYSWGMGTNGQLGTGEEEDVWEPFLVKSKQLANRKVIAVSSGGQHTVILAKDKEETPEKMEVIVEAKHNGETSKVNGDVKLNGHDNTEHCVASSTNGEEVMDEN